MCVYCLIADWAHRWVPGPFDPIPTPQPWPVPSPTPITPPNYPTPWQPPAKKLPNWTREQYEDLMEILRRVKNMEDKLGGCPCEEPSKMDFLKEVEKYLDAESRLPDESPKAEDHDKPIRYAHPK